MDDSQDISADDAERLEDEMQERALAESGLVLAAGNSAPFHLKSVENIKAGFAVSALSLKALMTTATLAKVAGKTFETFLAATVEVTQGVVRISTSSSEITARANLHVETFLPAERPGGVIFGIELSKLVRLAKCGQKGDELNFALIGGEEEDFLEVQEFRHGVAQNLNLRLSVFDSDAPSLLQGTRSFSHDIASTSAMSKAIKLCRTARTTVGKPDCSISIENGLATGYSRTAVVLIRNPELSALPIPVPLGESKKIGLAIQNMKIAKVYVSDSAVIVTDGILELAIKTAKAEVPVVGDMRERFPAQCVVTGDIQDLKKTYLVAETLMEHWRVRARRQGVAPEKYHIAHVRLEEGSLRFNVTRGPVVHDWVALPAMPDSQTENSEWGAIDLTSFSRVFAEIFAPTRGASKGITLAHCAHGMRFSCPEDAFEAYLSNFDSRDDRIRKR
ncbi:MAG: hypothetical protein EOS76_02905 [Mesorhizobium sp.]|uniref:hypothetical protein n=1 Tax=unclassified Mesorhizobium TaxID=325217 RepID=UPI000F757094|nr:MULTISPECIES: hypothetical protein [unclassified Mesorhizobium]AZO33550.1 hypothetical protein EJ072_02730 [Mesorhizobium sp. M2A.F.Ca.ET.046.03.2.1]RVC81775.1 hypothetical protein EN766_02585 [Mesorhizobium sp. M2A.F.Ca.ET.046.02.1.1]RWB42764.1 MAG: hypothetical protein EOQ44_20275 [Mesorhizobium sp.]RWE22018.1 MAG: hypothetical protein EOS76_02905 [Mesorhizobium sp.]